MMSVSKRIINFFRDVLVEEDTKESPHGVITVEDEDKPITISLKRLRKIIKVIDMLDGQEDGKLFERGGGVFNILLTLLNGDI